MTDFCVAYKNKQGDGAGDEPDSGWVRITDFVPYADARSAYEDAKQQLGDDTAIGLFHEHHGGQPWHEHRPRLLHNRHVLFSQAAVRQAFGGLINAACSDMF